MSSTEENGKLQERDKPFILVLLGTLTFLAAGIYAIVTGSWEQAKDFVGVLVPFVSMGWGFYFRSKTVANGA